MTEVWRSEAVHMAEAMNRYLTAHAVSASVLAQDPTRRDRLFAELAASEAPHVRRELRVDPNDDYMALLRDWDKAIAEEPTDFERFVSFVCLYIAPRIKSNPQPFLAPSLRRNRRCLLRAPLCYDRQTKIW